MDRWTPKRMKYLKRRLGLNPRTILDVGVARGTPTLYEAFPNKRYLLIEPLDVYADAIETIVENHHATWIRKAAGAAPGNLQFHHDVAKPALSSFHDKTPLEGSSGDVRTVDVEVDTLDNIVASTSVRGPFGLKIDTEGHELDVLRGATNVLKDTEFIVAEVSVSRRFEGGYAFSEFIAECAANGFHLVDVLKIAPNRLDGPPPKFMDLFFAKKRWDADATGG
ncbi:MAG: FkbM family methyltransferase [Acidimicrobiales bacterium]|nr:MAG: FkbM family methyltransferase [Acidimicrobiales bacterium]